MLVMHSEEGANLLTPHFEDPTVEKIAWQLLNR